MRNEPRHLKRWTCPPYYFGKAWPDYFSSGCDQSQESDAPARSNFACMLTALGGASDTVLVVHESHWAVGWVEWIAIHETDARALAVADEIAGKLKDDPVIDESHLSVIEQEDADLLWRDGFRVEDRVAYIRQHRDQFLFDGYADLLGCVRGNYFRGVAPELLRNFGSP
jgi:hypothetical protein